MSITELYSADIFVSDLDRAIDFYVNALGFEKRADQPMDDAGHRWVEVAPKGAASVFIVAHDFGHWRAERVGGWSGLIFEVEDMEATVRDLKAAGVTFTDEPEAFPFGVYAVAQDPDGNTFGLIEPPRGDGAP